MGVVLEVHSPISCLINIAIVYDVKSNSLEF